jgi:hypothetical protein
MIVRRCVGYLELQIKNWISNEESLLKEVNFSLQSLSIVEDKLVLPDSDYLGVEVCQLVADNNSELLNTKRTNQSLERIWVREVHD